MREAKTIPETTMFGFYLSIITTSVPTQGPHRHNQQSGCDDSNAKQPLRTENQQTESAKYPAYQANFPTRNKLRNPGGTGATKDTGLHNWFFTQESQT